jgi:dihydroorotase
MSTQASVRLVNLRLICAYEGELEASSLVIDNGVLSQPDPATDPQDQVPEIDCEGMFCCQGFVDLLSEGGEPGNEDKEDFETLGLAAIQGGYTTVCVSPDTQPVNDSRSVTEWIHRRAGLVSLVDVLPIAAATKALDGDALADLYDLKEAGVAGVQFGRGSIRDSGLMRRTYEYAKGLDLLVFERPLDQGLHRGGLMHEGRWATEAGVKGSPSAAEDVAVSRAIALAHLVQSPIHIGPLSSGRSVEMVRRAKADGLPVTASVNALNLVYTSKTVRDLMHPSLNVIPPLRDERDRLALLAGLSDGTIDAISSGHSAQTSADKQRPFEWSTPGACTLPLVMPLLLELVRQGEIDLKAIIECLSRGSRQVLGLKAEPLRQGGGRSLVIVDPNETWEPASESLGSKGRNLPLFQTQLTGRIHSTLVQGHLHLAAEGGSSC